MEYYYSSKENINEDNNIIYLKDFEFKHLVKVLRKKTGDLITVTDGCRNIYHCRIKSIDNQKLECIILNKEYNLYEPKLNISLYISPLRNQDRFEFAIEKAVELGVNSIHIVVTEYSQNKNSLSESKIIRLRKIMISAMGQSQRCILPELFNTVDLNNLIQVTSSCHNKIVMYESSEDISKINIENQSNEVILLIGPEGGFSKSEISDLIKNAWQVKSLGKRKLRSETAAIISVYNLLLNNNF